MSSVEAVAPLHRVWPIRFRRGFDVWHARVDAGRALGSSILVAHWLGPKGFGTLAVLNATVALTLQIASAGLPSANTYFIARDRRNLGPVWANAVMFALVVGSLAALVIFALGKLKPSLFGGAPTPCWASPRFLPFSTADSGRP